MCFWKISLELGENEAGRTVRKLLAQAEPGEAQRGRAGAREALKIGSQLVLRRDPDPGGRQGARLRAERRRRGDRGQTQRTCGLGGNVHTCTPGAEKPARKQERGRGKRWVLCHREHLPGGDG